MKEYENKNSIVLKLLSNFNDKFDNERYYKMLRNKNSNLIESICSGSEQLPPPSFFKYLINKNSDKNIEFDAKKAEEVSYRFYYLFFTIGMKNIYDYKKFSNEFRNKVQKLGDLLIQYIQLLNYRIKNESENKFHTKIFNNIKISFTELYIIDPEKFLSLYKFFSCTSIIISTFIAFMLGNIVGSMYASCILSTSIGAISVIYFINTYEKKHFENLDIDGRNILALKYKKLFTEEINTISKKNQYTPSLIFDVIPDNSDTNLDKILEIV